MWVYILMAIVVIFLITFLIIYNSFVRENNKVKEAFATMDVYLKKRWDLIPNIVETVKGYAEYEKNAFTEVIALRNVPYDQMSNGKKIETNQKIASGVHQIMALAEGYPELKASENFKELSDQLTKIEDEIAYARKYYNATVRDFNNKVEMFPSNFVAKLLGYQSKNMFEVTEEERTSVNVKI